MKQPKAGDHVLFPDTRPNHRGEYINTIFDQGGTHLLIRTDAKSNAAWYVDDAFKDMFQIDYQGQASNGKAKWLVKFRRDLPPSKQIWTVVLLYRGGKQGVYETTAPTERKALANAVVRWCGENNIPRHRYKYQIDLWTQNEPTEYSYKITPIER